MTYIADHGSRNGSEASTGATGADGFRVSLMGGDYPAIRAEHEHEHEHEVDGTMSALDKLRAALVDSAGLDSIPEPEPVVDEFLYRDSIAWLIGPPGTGKSFVALDVAGSVGTGRDWQGRSVAKGGVLFLVAEGLSGIRPRVRAWEQGSGADMSGVSFLPVAVQAADPFAWQAFVALAAELQPALIIIDTQARVTVGLEENSARDMGEFVHRAEKLRETTRACVLIVHHQGRAGDHMRGSTALEGAATTIVRVAKDDELLTIECAKQKDAAPFEDFMLRMVHTGSSVMLQGVDGVGVALAGGTAKMVRDWWNTFGDAWCGTGQLTDATAVSKSSLYRSLPDLKGIGLVEVDDSGRYPRYRLTSAPEGV